MINYFNFYIGGNSSKLLDNDITKFISPANFTFSIKFDNIDNYPKPYDTTYQLTNLYADIEILHYDDADNNEVREWKVHTTNVTKTFVGNPVYVALLLDVDSNSVGIYADGAFVDTIDDGISFDNTVKFNLSNRTGGATYASFSEVLFFNRLLTSSEAELTTTGFVTPPNVTITPDVSKLTLTSNAAVFPNVVVPITDTQTLAVSSFNVIVHGSANIQVPSLQALSVIPCEAAINEFGNIDIKASITSLGITSNKVVETPEDYVVQHWNFTNEDGSSTKLDTKGVDGFTDSETSVHDDLPSIISIPKNYLYYRPVWNDSNFDYGNGTVKVAGEAQLSGLVSGSKSFSFWIYRPFIADVSDNTAIIIDGDYAFYVSPSFGNTTTLNADWSLVVVVYDKVANNRKTYVDNVLFKTDTYAEISNGKFTLCETESGTVDVKVAIRDIESYSYALSVSDVDMIYNFYYKYMIVRPDISSMAMHSLFTENWYNKCTNGIVVDVVPNTAYINEFLNVYSQNTATVVTIIPLQCVGLAEHTSTIRLIPMPPMIVGEAYLDFQDTSLCDLYFDKDMTDDATTNTWGVRYVTTALMTFTKDISSDTTSRASVDTSLYASNIVKGVVKQAISISTYGLTFVQRVNGMGHAISTRGGVPKIEVDGVIHAFVFSISTAPASYAYLCAFGFDDMSVKIMSDLSIKINGATVPIQPLVLNKEYTIRFSLSEGVFLNSYQIAYPDPYYVGHAVNTTLLSFGYSQFDTDADVLDAYFCNYKLYGFAISFVYNALTFINPLGLEYHRLLSEAGKSSDTFIALPYTKNVLTTYTLKPEIPTLKIHSINPDFYGQVSVNVIVPAIPAVITMFQNFLKPPHNVYLKVATSILNMVTNTKVCEFVTPKPSVGYVFGNFVRVGGDCVLKCVKIDNIEFKTSLVFSSDDNIVMFKSKSEKAIDNSNIVSVRRIPKFSIDATLATSNKNYVHYVIIEQLKNIINTNTHIAYFNDGSYHEFKFDVLSSPLVCEPIYEGSDYYKIKVRIIK